VWNNIAGATSNIFYLNGTDEFAGMVIRCLITNSGNYTTTTAYTVKLASALPSPSPASIPSGYTSSCTTALVLFLHHSHSVWGTRRGGSDSGPIVGGVVGGVAGFVLLLLLVLLVIGIILARRSGLRRRQKKLRQPNFGLLAYGAMKDIGAVPKSKQQVSACAVLMHRYHTISHVIPSSSGV
jgi:hypothetical protein